MLTSKRNNHVDVVIVGAGIVGSSIARLLSSYRIRVLLIEKAEDVCSGSSKANSGVIHGGYTALAGTTKGKLSIRGNRMYKDLAEQLGFPYKQTGSYTLAFTDEEEHTLHTLRENGMQNGVSGLEIISATHILSREQRVNPSVQAALYCPGTGVTSPYEACMAVAENAIDNGVTLLLNTEVIGLEKQNDHFLVHTSTGTAKTTQTYVSGFVINAAGIHADTIESFLGLKNFSIIPRKGEYMVLRRGTAEGIQSVLFQTPGTHGKGVLVVPTCWDNVILGPNAEKIQKKEDRSTHVEVLRTVFDTALKSVPDLKPRDIIRTFAGVRTTSDSSDFIIGETSIKGFINVAGIDSPGLTAAPAIAEKVLKILEDGGAVSPQHRKQTFSPRRQPIQSWYPLRPFTEIRSDIDKDFGDPDRIVCRCEQVREAQITDALSRKVPIVSMDGVKFRTRAGMGNCQGQFCGQRVHEYIEKHISNGTEITPAYNSEKDVLKAAREFTVKK